MWVKEGAQGRVGCVGCVFGFIPISIRLLPTLTLRGTAMEPTNLQSLSVAVAASGWVGGWANRSVRPSVRQTTTNAQGKLCAVYTNNKTQHH